VRQTTAEHAFAVVRARDEQPDGAEATAVAHGRDGALELSIRVRAEEAFGVGGGERFSVPQARVPALARRPLADDDAGDAGAVEPLQVDRQVLVHAVFRRTARDVP
jgi:hypothetical protein